MAIPRTGALGAAALGSLRLGAPLIWGGAVPPTTQHARSALSAAKPASALSAAGARSALTAAVPQGRIE